MSTKPKAPKAPKGARNISYTTKEGQNGYPVHNITYWIGLKLCSVKLMEDEFGELAVDVFRNSAGLKLPEEPMQAEAIQWFHDKTGYIQGY